MLTTVVWEDMRIGLSWHVKKKIGSPMPAASRRPSIQKQHRAAPVGATSLADIATPSWLDERRTAGLALRNRQTRALIGFADTQTQQSAPKNMRFRLESRFFSISIRYASENAVFGW